jgi:hypothetical protein
MAAYGRVHLAIDVLLGQPVILFPGITKFRHYPTECGIQIELCSFFILTTGTNMFFEINAYWFRQSCFLITYDCWGNLIRNVAFQIISMIYPMRKSIWGFPLPPVEVFEDLELFIKTDWCFEIFDAYIEEKGDRYGNLFFIIQSRKGCMDQLYESLASDVRGQQRGVYVLSTCIVGSQGVSIRQPECAIGLSARHQGVGLMQGPSDGKFGDREHRHEWDP